MEWQDEGLILNVKAHGETSAIAEIFTQSHGRCLGLVKGGKLRSLRALLQPGNHVSVAWRARLEDHLGQFTLEALHLRAGLIIENSLRLSALATMSASAQVLPEREPHPKLYQALLLVFDHMEDDALWPGLMARWEMGLLDELGFGLDLSACAATGAKDNLDYVSPRSGKAVCREAASPYLAKLFKLPGFLKGEKTFTPDDVCDALLLTGYFLERHIFGPRNLSLPQARLMLEQALRRAI